MQIVKEVFLVASRGEKGIGFDPAQETDPKLFVYEN